MRQQQLKPKIQAIVEVPEELKLFCIYTNSLIENRDPAAMLSSDDLIQTKGAYAGLMEGGSDRYAVSYFSGPSTDSKWEMEFTANEITQIALSRVTQISLWSCSNPECGRLFAGSGASCFDCDYIDPERDERKRILALIIDRPSRDEWLTAYLQHLPDEHFFQIIGDYNSQPGLGDKWGWWTTAEIQDAIARAKATLEKK